MSKTHIDPHLIKDFFMVRNAAELFEDFIRAKQNSVRVKSPNTIKSIEYSFKHLKPYLSRMHPSLITEEWWRDVYIRTLRAKFGRDRKFMNDRKWLSAYLRWLHSRGVIKRLPLLENPDPPLKDVHTYTRDQILTLIKDAGPAIKLQILFAYLMGLRKTEIRTLRWDDINFDTEQMRIRWEIAKIRKGRVVPIHPHVMAELKKRRGLQKYSQSIFVFPNPKDPSKPQNNGIERAWQRLKARHGIEGHFHDLRKTCISEMVMTGANIAEISKIVGAGIDVLQRRYINVIPDKKTLIKADYLNAALNEEKSS